MRRPEFSPKQRAVLDWWRDGRYDAVICDGAVRSGKTFALSAMPLSQAPAPADKGQIFPVCSLTVGTYLRYFVKPFSMFELNVNFLVIFLTFQKFSVN